MFDIYKKETGREVTEEEKISSQLTNFIYNIYKHNKVNTELSFFTICPTLFASVRWNKGQQFDRNHMMDFLHASCALPFFDYFFTENQLHTIIKQRKLDTQFNCTVESKKDKVFEILNELITER